TKVFTQRWYPIRELGPVDRATAEAAVSLRVADGVAQVGVIATRSVAEARIEVIADGVPVAEQVAHLDPASPYRASHPLPAGAGPVTVTVRDGDRVLVSWTEPAPVDPGPEPEP